MPGYLLHDVGIVITPNPAFSGQYGDLPFQDPWWKIVLCIIAVLLLIGAAIAEATGGSGSVEVSAGNTDTGSPNGDCCGVRAGGGGTSYVAAGLVAAAAAVATAAALSDIRDPIRRGQDNTVPASGEMTIGERLDAVITYVESVALGRPFKVQADWTYTRVTTGNAYTYSVSEINQNQHVLSQYNITAPDIVHLYQGDPWVVEAAFFDENGKQLHGGDLFVQCILVAPHGEYFNIVLQDDGISPDTSPDDGTYTAEIHLRCPGGPCARDLAVLRHRSGYQHRAAEHGPGGSSPNHRWPRADAPTHHQLRWRHLPAGPRRACQCDLVAAQPGLFALDPLSPIPALGRGRSVTGMAAD